MLLAITSSSSLLILVMAGIALYVWKNRHKTDDWFPSHDPYPDFTGFPFIKEKEYWGPDGPPEE